MEQLRRDLLKYATVGAAGIIAPLKLGAQPASHLPSGAIYDVRAFGATGDGKTIDSPAINRAIDAAAAAGGGTVVFTAGSYNSFSIRLKSNVALRLLQGSTIVAADTPANGNDGYDAAESNVPWENYQDYGHNHWHNSLIWGEGLHDITIDGPGLIWGKGLSRGWSKEQPLAESSRIGNKAIALKNCRNIILRDFSVLKGGHFGILATGVDNLTIDNLKIDTDRDGMDIDCCKNVRVSNCTVNSPWDDAICPKSSYALGYARATENVTITNCYVTGCYELGTVLDGTFKKFPPDAHVPRTGRIKCGTESNGGFKNITVSNCVFEGCNGIALESEDGALLEDIAFTNITMRDISESPIFIRLGSRMRGPQGVPIGDCRRIILSNIVSYNSASKYAAIISGIPDHPITDMKVSNVYLHHQGGGTAEMAAMQPPESEAGYPDPHMFGPMPAHGFFIRHVNNIELINVEIASATPDARPAFVLDSVTDADFFRIKVPADSHQQAFRLKNTTNFRVFGSPKIKDKVLETATSEEF
ncbi:glycoside hydrolase family 28 protein [Acidobacterium sp. S8]|uniref:rhamnogalacturonidase n=1 Tax=Acidobacterium sp. S8 TaxID=1641854 RepID=UPI00131A7B6C|nr:glycoside hydrolase family 28 protein [Acidobacterium sp. S8]